jgi:8-oxo-dGTP pyrophosphatase MutT (NUDIX family)
MNAISLQDYPVLSDVIDWGPVRARFVLSETFDEARVSNVTVIPFAGEQVVVFRVEGGLWELPGGTLEPGERYPEAARREVMEELGGELLSFRVFGRLDCESSADKPYRPHIPHPKFIRLVGYGEVSLVGEPTNPPDGERVAAVETVELAEAVRRFEAIGRRDIAELYRLAHHVRAADRR